MNKKTIIGFLVIVLVIFASGCKSSKNIDKEENKVNPNNNSAVIYFSATGTTKNVAEKIAEESNSDLIEIIPEVEYTSDDLNYNSDCRANREQNDSTSRPKIKNKIDISKYDTIYLGYPIWWGTNPKIILTLLDTHDFSGKTIIPFCTSGSTNITGSVNDLRKYNPNLNIKAGKRFSSSASDEEVHKFVGENSNFKKTIDSIKISINENEYEIILEDNETAKSFVNLLPQELNMNELNGNEKYVYLDKKLPTESLNPKRINAGDVMLYGDNCLVIFYKSFDTTYSYTKIGHIDNLPDLGTDSIKVKLYK